MFRVERKWCAHTGGTKFYQTITIQTASKSVCILHWGKWPGAVPMPSNTSYQSQFEVFNTQSGAEQMAREKIAAKKTRGYNTWSSNWDDFDEAGLSNWLAVNANPNHVKDIASHFSLSAPKKAPPAPKPVATPAPKPTRQEPAMPKPDGWGSW